MNKIYRKFTAFLKDRREEGNSFLLYIFLIPVICGAVGLGIDTSMAQYVRSGLQNSADSATVAGAQKTSYNGSQRVIDQATADKQTRALYNQERKNYPAVTSTTPTISTKIVTVNGVKMLRTTINEKSPTVFLHILGVNEMKYTIVSEARIGSSRQ
ncbi:MAG: hypothetical protein H9W81_07500 [Enterococcus sp.]|nr:hypothetical protein [Enterococcus sp.]